VGTKKRIILTGGGTGGHIFPAIAVARELSKHPEVELLYVGKKEGLESKWVPDSGFAFEGVTASGFPRGLSLRLLTFWFELAKGLAQAGRIVGSFAPQAVFSTGGYV
jgi:UDP-N-acetylglucosamine--N-acetylmuramyl-(pentapeptide) pyrophosphoryl-undecaprenol N-acetylglucosamine transferase